MHALPAEVDPGDVFGQHDFFAPGTDAVVDFSSPQSQCDFLRTAISMQPPPSRQSILDCDPLPAKILPPHEAQQLQQRLGQPPDFVAGCLFQHAPAWHADLQVPAYVSRWMRDGYSEYFPRPVPFTIKPNHPSAHQHAGFVTDQVQDLQRIQAIEDVTSRCHDRAQVAAILPLLVAEPEHRKMRMCWNGRHVNASLDVPSFKMEHAPKAAAMLKPGDWLFTIDMKSGYHQIPLKPSFQKFCCFAWQDRVYRWRVMPFGLSSAPRAYTKLSRVMLAYWRRQGIRCSNYIDDFLFAAATREEALRLRDQVLRDMIRFGWFISFSKSLLEPGQLAAYIGFEFITLSQPIVRVPARKITYLLALIARMLEQHAQRRRIPGLDMARIAGHLQSMRFAMPPVNLFTRAMYEWMGSLPLHTVAGLNYAARLPLTAAAVLELQFWQQQLPTWNGVAIQQSPFTRVLYTDASAQRWGALVQRVSERREEPAHMLASHEWEWVSSVDSVYTELLALRDALVTFAADLSGQSVLHRTDNISSYWVVAHAGSRRSERLTALARSIWLVCLQCSIALASEYVGADVIIRKGADALSRWQDDMDCRLAPHLFADLWRLCGPFQVDRFATATNVQRNPATGEGLPFTSRFLEPGSLGMDALTADWSDCCNYAFPPPSILDRVVPLIQRQRARTLLIAPLWPSALWWPILYGMDPVVIELPCGLSPFLPHRSGCSHPFGRGFHHPELHQFAAFWFAFPICRLALLICPAG